ncbi:MAG: FeoA family protein [Planctomycetota bacterium]|jgi:Fe2+ transport system protein FeoA
MDQAQTQSLNDISAGKKVRIVSIEAGKDLKNRLAALGLLVNVEIKVLRNDGAGQIIVNVKNSKVILGRGMSHKVLAVEI